MSAPPTDYRELLTAIVLAHDADQAAVLHELMEQARQTCVLKPTGGPSPTEICQAACETLQTIDQWLGSASTRQAAVDAIWRLSRLLQGAGFALQMRDDLKWRGSIIRALEQAGIGVDGTGILVRVRMRDDAPHQHASGPVITPDRLWGYVLSHGTDEERARLGHATRSTP